MSICPGVLSHWSHTASASGTITFSYQIGSIHPMLSILTHYFFVKYLLELSNVHPVLLSIVLAKVLPNVSTKMLE